MSDTLLANVGRVAPHVQFNVTMLEPQDLFTTRLTRIASRWQRANATPPTFVRYIHAVAGTRDGTSMLFLSTNNEAVSTLESASTKTWRRSKRRSAEVQAISLSRLLREAWDGAGRDPHNASRPRRPLIMLKMDIEGGEVSLLPHLLVTGALCYVSYLRVEYHLNTIEEERRLGVVALKHALRSTLAHGCVDERAELEAGYTASMNGTPSAVAPSGLRLSKGAGAARVHQDERLASHGRQHGVVVESEEYRPINFGERVPGLLEEAVRHFNETPTGGQSPKSLGFSWVLKVTKQKVRPKVIFHTESGQGVSTEEVTPGTNL